MSLLESYRHGRRLARLTRAWYRLHPYVHTNGSERLYGSAEDFLALKKVILRDLGALEGSFGSPALDREADQAASRIRHLLAQIPTREHVDAWFLRDSDGLAKAWHGVFLHLSVLSGARARRSPILAAMWGAPKIDFAAGGRAARGSRGALHGLFRGALAVLAIVVAFLVAERLFRSMSGGGAGDDLGTSPTRAETR